jgi:hypothetical protein
MYLIRGGVLVSGLLFSACVSAGPEPPENTTIPPLDVNAPAVFETATFSLG